MFDLHYTISRAAHQEALEEARDIIALLKAGAHEDAIGEAEARTDHLSDDLVGRLLDGEAPVRIWREHRGLSAAALADAAGLPRSYLAELEAGNKPGSISAYRSLAEVLSISLDDIVPEIAEDPA